MNRLARVTHNRAQRKNRVRTLVSGTPERPRLTVHISNRHITAQIIDDTVGRTLAYVTTVGGKQSGAMSEQAAWVGKEIAGKAKVLNIKTVAFDRGYKLYHGRVAQLADAARNAGLEF